jgi:RNA polymerase sigma factor (sigma-70 family)
MNTTLLKKLEELAGELNAAARFAIRRTALWMGRHVDPATAEDLVQEVWLVAFRRIYFYTSPAQLKTFFAKTAAHLTLAHLRGRVPLPLDGLVEPDDGGLEAARIEAAALARGFLDARGIPAALNRLSARNQEIVRLTYCKHLSPRDISARTGLSERAVRQRLRRTLKVLFGQLTSRQRGSQ